MERVAFWPVMSLYSISVHSVHWGTNPLVLNSLMFIELNFQKYIASNSNSFYFDNGHITSKCKLSSHGVAMEGRTWSGFGIVKVGLEITNFLFACVFSCKQSHPSDRCQPDIQNFTVYQTDQLTDLSDHWPLTDQITNWKEDSYHIELKQCHNYTILRPPVITVIWRYLDVMIPSTKYCTALFFVEFSIELYLMSCNTHILTLIH